MKRLAAVILLASACLPLADQASAQEKKQLPVDHPDLYSAFFFFVEDFTAWLDARNADVPANKTRLTQSAARYLHVDPADLPKISEACRLTAFSIRQIDTEARQYWEGESKKKGSTPDVNVVRQFQARRQAVIQTGIDQLKRTLSPTAWAGVQAYINGAQRAAITAAPAKPLP